MTAGEVGRLWAVVLTLHRASARPLTDDEAAIMARLMRDVSLPDAIAAVERRARRGEHFAPEAGEIVAEAYGAGHLPFHEGLELLRRAGGWYGWDRLDEAQAWISAASPQFGAFVERYGLRRAMLEPLDGDAQGPTRAAMRKAWEDFLRAYPEVTALPARRAVGHATPHRELGA